MRATVHNLKSYAKINLSLNVIGKRKSNKLHSIETFVSLINLADEIKINEVDSKNHKVIFAKFYPTRHSYWQLEADHFLQCNDHL